jgi:hypothetical protein
MATSDNRRTLAAIAGVAGPILLAAAVFMPWYGLTLTANGASMSQQALNAIAQHFGNPTFQLQAQGVGLSFQTMIGQQIATVSAHQTLRFISVILLIVAGAGLLMALARLVGARPGATRGPLALIGAAGTICVLFRLFVPPQVESGYLSVSVTWGLWIALLGTLMIAAGDLLWPGDAESPAPAPVVVIPATRRWN